MNMSILVPNLSPATEYAAKYLKQYGLYVTDVPDYDVAHLLLPVPSFPGGSRYITPLLASLPHSVVISGGNLDHPAVSGYTTVDFLKDPYYLAANAAITAKCALDLPRVLWKDLPVLVIGWGRIGKCLMQNLTALGAGVTVAARKDADLAMIRALGAKSVPVASLPGKLPAYRVIFNTVPEMILPDMVCHPDCIPVELASRPGMSGGHILNGRGLPGKYAPAESGRLIADTFMRLALKKEDTL